MITSGMLITFRVSVQRPCCLAVGGNGALYSSFNINSKARFRPMGITYSYSYELISCMRISLAGITNISFIVILSIHTKIFMPAVTQLLLHSNTFKTSLKNRTHVKNNTITSEMTKD